MGGEEDAAYAELAGPYQDDMDFAFFVVHFGYNRVEYDMLTKRQRAFILKAWEDKTVQESTLLRNAALNAVTNAMRKKGKPFCVLWKKKQQKADIEIVQEQMRIAREVDEKDGGAWIDKLRAAYGRR